MGIRAERKHRAAKRKLEILNELADALETGGVEKAYLLLKTRCKQNPQEAHLWMEVARDLNRAFRLAKEDE